MKKLILGLCLLFPGLYATAQNGLDSIYVEKYYVSNAADAAGAGVGILPAGSVTWRIYACLQPGYKVQAVYGVPGHDVLFKTTTVFYNNPGGSHVPNFSKAQLAANSTMLDSYLSMGSSSTGSGINRHFGVLKSEDDGVANVVNSNAPQILQNNNPSVGIPLTTQDGLLLGTVANPAQAVTVVGMSNGVANELDVLEDGTANGNTFTTTNGSWAVLSTGVSGPLPSNRVLIAQITTDGVFNYKLNLQIGTPTPGVSQNFVAENPVGTEISIPSLIDTLNQPNTLPTVSITNPLNGATFVTGNPVTIDATAFDADGIQSVAFYVNAALVNTDNSFPYQFIWPSTVGTKILTAVATDNLGGQTTSAPVTITVGNNTPPTISITSPANGFSTTAPTVVPISATAADPGGNVDSVQFFVNAVYVGSDNSGPSPFTFGWTSTVGNKTLTAKAWDNAGASTLSAGVNITVLDTGAAPYTVTGITATCVPSSFCLPVTAVDSVNDVIGYDVVLHYDTSRVYPTGNITVSNAMIFPSWTTTANSIDAVHGLMNISVYFNVTAPPTAKFFGKGDVFCVEFVKKSGFGDTDTADFNVSFLQESYANGVQTKDVDPAQYITYRDSIYNGSLRFWLDQSPIQYDPLNPTDHLITNIYGTDPGCDHTPDVPVQPDLLGNFVYNTFNAPVIDIDRNIAAATDVMPVINGFDAFLTRKVLINDVSFIPSVFQMIAMDVNTDGTVSAGDLSQINQRAVLMIAEFKQDWNYDAAGIKIPGTGDSKDWLFIDGHTLTSNGGYLISSIYPFNDNVGYSKAKVPQVPFCHPLQILDYSGCPQITPDYYEGVLVGDANGNFSTTVPNSLFRASADNSIIFDLSNAKVVNGFIDIPVSVNSTVNVNALDFSFKFNESNLTFNAVVDNTNSLEALVNFNETDKKVRFTSNSLQNYDISQAPVSVRFAVSGTTVSASDLNSMQGFINGNRSGIQVTTTSLSTAGDVNVYPNPASDALNIVSSENANMQLLGIDGKLILMQHDITADQKFVINTRQFVNGIYLVKIYNENFITMKKVVINN